MAPVGPSRSASGIRSRRSEPANVTPGEIAVYFKPFVHLAFQRADEPRPNVLCLRLGPDKVTLNPNVNGPFDLEQVDGDRSRERLDLSSG
jgi:hypothetical protein